MRPIVTTNPTHEPTHLQFASGTLLWDGSGSDRPPAADAVAWVWDRRVSAWRCDAISYDVVRRALAACGQTAIDAVPEWHAVHWRKLEIHPLRAEQRDALQAWLQSRRGVVVMPTGTGKTEVALTIMQQT